MTIQPVEEVNHMNDDTMRVLVLIFVILYVLSPIDGCPGPIDDLIVIIMGAAVRRNLRD